MKTSNDFAKRYGSVPKSNMSLFPGVRRGSTSPTNMFGRGSGKKLNKMKFDLPTGKLRPGIIDLDTNSSLFPAPHTTTAAMKPPRPAFDPEKISEISGDVD